MTPLLFDQLTPIQQIIAACVERSPGRYTRSELAKLLVGSRSTRAAELADQPDYGRLAGHGRKAITIEIDILVQQGYLEIDAGGHLEKMAAG